MPSSPTSCLFFRPAALQSFASCCGGESKPSIQFGVGNHFSIVNNLSRTSSIGRLFQTRSPFAIIWAIIAIIVNPFHAESVRAIPHVINKILEGSPPSVTHFDSAPTVIFVISGCRIFASTDDSTPYSVKRVFGGIDSTNDLGGSFSGNLPITTTAGCCGTLPQITKPDVNFFATIAEAKHSSCLFWSDSIPFSNHSKSRKSGSFFDIELNRHTAIMDKAKSESRQI